MLIGGGMAQSVQAEESPLMLVYPPDGHETTAAQIFLIGSAPSEGVVLVNDRPIPRSTAGHFAPSFPLELGENRFTLRYGDRVMELTVVRRSPVPALPDGLGFGPNSLEPSADIARLPNELFCFDAIATPNAAVSVTLSSQQVRLQPQATSTLLPSNAAVLTGQNQPLSASGAGHYQGCTAIAQPGSLGRPTFTVSQDGQTITQPAPGTVTILNPAALDGVEVVATEGVARTGPSTNHSRLTPLPQGTRAAVTGREGDWLRLDYGGWIRAKEAQPLAQTGLPRSIIRSVLSRPNQGWTDVVFPLTVPVPISVQQRDREFILTLHNTTAQTDTIYLAADPVIRRLDWQQVAPSQVEYRFQLQPERQWGHRLRYEGSSLILSLRHPPQPSSARSQPLSGIRILLDPGHGGDELGARGPNGLPEKTVNLTVSNLLKAELEQRGATVYMTRDSDEFVSLRDRMDAIDQLAPTLALSIHYNALPDNGDAINTAGIGAFWYHGQAHELAQFLHDYLVKTLDRPAYGVYWNNLALTRPNAAPTVLLELGFMINPTEFEWIVDPAEQERLAGAIAEGIVTYIKHHR